MASFGETFSKCSKCRVLVNVTTLRRLLCPFCGAVIKKASHANDAETALASAVGANFASEETAELRATADEHTMTPEQTSLHLPSIISTPNRLPSIAQPGFNLSGEHASSASSQPKAKSTTILDGEGNIKALREQNRKGTTGSSNDALPEVVDENQKHSDQLVASSEKPTDGNDSSQREQGPRSQKSNVWTAKLGLVVVHILQPSGQAEQKRKLPTLATTRFKTVAKKLAKRWNVEEMLAARDRAQEQGSWSEIATYFNTCFSSFMTLNYAFLKDNVTVLEENSTCVLDLDLVKVAYDVVMSATGEVQRGVLKAIVRALVQERQTIKIEDVRAVFILLQSPLFDLSNSCVVFAYLLKLVVRIPLHDKQLMRYLHWLDPQTFRRIIHRLHGFISLRLFPPSHINLPPLFKTGWWIPYAVRVMALMYATNYKFNRGSDEQPKVHYTEFYNHTLDYLDLIAEFVGWQTNSPASFRFSFCHYPFVLSILAKRSIIQKDWQHQMITNAKTCVTAQNTTTSDRGMSILYLNIEVRRSHLVQDSLKEIELNHRDLKRKLRVKFAGEHSADLSGMTKEWFLLLLHQIFDPERGLFFRDEKSKVFWFTNTSTIQRLEEYHLLGVLMGLSVYNGVNVDVKFPACCFRKLLSPPVVPLYNPQAVVGVAPVTLEDLKLVLPDVAHGLEELLLYEGDVEEDFFITFQANFVDNGVVRCARLKPDGENLLVNNLNKWEFVQLYVDWVLNHAIYKQFRAFYYGFQGVCASNALVLLRPEEVELLVCGDCEFNMSDLRKVVIYDGFQPNERTIRWFWDAVTSLSKENQRKLLHFVTGSERVSVGGVNEMTLKISRAGNTDTLPVAHKSFNQLLLPPYETKKKMFFKLSLALQKYSTFANDGI